MNGNIHPSASQRFLREVFSCPRATVQPLLLLFLLAGSALISPAETSTPDWKSSEKAPSKSTNKEQTAGKQRENSTKYESGARVRFVSYNLRNYLTMRRGKKYLPKPEAEINDLVENIVRAKPDILGVCEIGTEKNVADLQSRLQKSGVSLPYTYLFKGPDPVRRLAVLSKFKINSHPLPARSYTIGRREFQVRRGFIDFSITSPVGDLRFIGAHLKSKLPLKGYSQAAIRRHESILLRERATSILKQKQPPLLIVYGDMNDTKRSQPIRSIKGSSRGKLSLKPIELRAKNGTKWTQYWAAEDIYSRFDYVFTSKPLRAKVDYKSSYIISDSLKSRASDHRALVVTFK